MVDFTLTGDVTLNAIIYLLIAGGEITTGITILFRQTI
jgi:hypothetical protein